MLRSAGAVAGGFIGMAVIVMLGTMVLMTMVVPGGLAAMRSGGAPAMPAPTARYYAMNIVLSFLAAVAGGWLTARIAVSAPVGHVEALCALILVMGAVSASSTGSRSQPSWYKILIPLIGVAGAAASLFLARSAV